MANKRRPKKVKAPYKRYGPGVKHRPFTVEEEGIVGRLNDMGIYVPNSDILELIQSTDAEIMPGIHYSDVFLPSCVEETTVSVGKLGINDSAVFPVEIFAKILQFHVEPQFLRVCTAWFVLCTPLLYRSPKLTPRNFLKFVEAISSKRKVGRNVVVLDLSTIIQSGKNSCVSKLLRRCSENLDSFVAPQTSFGYAPLISLKSCHKLTRLDLGLVSETVVLKELFAAISGFHQLTHLSFPRSSVECTGFEDFTWPPNLKYLKLCGGISNEFLIDTKFPMHIDTLEFSYCPVVQEHAIYHMLGKMGEFLKELYFHYPMPALQDNSLDYVFRYCPNLVFLQIMTDYCSQWMFSENLLTELYYPRPLTTIFIQSSGMMGQTAKIMPDDLTIAIMEDRLPCLKNVRITTKLSWDLNGDDVSELVDLLEERGGGIYMNY